MRRLANPYPVCRIVGLRRAVDCPPGALAIASIQLEQVSGMPGSVPPTTHPIFAMRIELNCAVAQTRSAGEVSRLSRRTQRDSKIEASVKTWSRLIAAVYGYLLCGARPMSSVLFCFSGVVQECAAAPLL